MAIAADSWSAVGITSLELWQRLTSSLGWTFRPRRAGARPGGDDLVHVGVRRGARAGLVDVDRELVVVVAVGDRAAAAAIAAATSGSSSPRARVRLGRGELDQRERADEPAREPLARRSGS